MPEREALKTALELFVAWIAIFGVALSIPDPTLPLNFKLFIGGVSAIVITIYAVYYFYQKPDTETEKLAAYAPIHTIIVRVNNEIPREQALQGSVGTWVRASLIDFNNISAVFNKHIDKFRDKDLKMWIDIEKEIKAGNGFYLGRDRQEWFDELDVEYKRLKEHKKT